MLELRDGSVTSDRRLDRLIDFDPRSRGYPVAELVGDLELRSQTWWTPLHLNQGTEGACVGFACTHELVAKPNMHLKGRKFAREQVYWEAQKIDEWPGGAYPGADPYMEGSSVLAGMKVLRAAGYITEYRWAFSIDELALAIGHQGPAVLGISWYEGMMRGVHLEATGSQVGKHAILCKGIDVARRRFRLHNSWGVSWGCFGDAWLGWDDLERLLAEDGEACIPVSRT